ncbi:MAG: flagellar motor switch protein FliG [Planctomycetota bacterium]
MADDSLDMSGIRKAAIFLMSVGQETAAEVLKRLDGEAVENVSREIAAMEGITSRQRDAVLTEFYNVALASGYMEEGGLPYATALLRKSLDPNEASRIIEQVSAAISSSPFSFLQKAESENLLTFIQDEHPQTIALILAHLHADKASEILSGLASSKQIEVVKRVANMEQTNPEVIREVEQALEHRLAAIVGQSFEKAGGIESVAGMLNLADRATEKSIMEGLEAEDPELVESIRRLMFVFEDILQVQDQGIQAVLKEVENDELALALKTASEELKDKLFRNMSERASELILEEMEYMGPVRVSDVEAAQQKIVDIVRRLEDAGELVIAGRGGGDDIVE